MTADLAPLLPEPRHDCADPRSTPGADWSPVVQPPIQEDDSDGDAGGEEESGP
jgi:hypothetical protein